MPGASPTFSMAESPGTLPGSFFSVLFLIWPTALALFQPLSSSNQPFSQQIKPSYHEGAVQLQKLWILAASRLRSFSHKIIPYIVLQKLVFLHNFFPLSTLKLTFWWDAHCKSIFTSMFLYMGCLEFYQSPLYLKRPLNMLWCDM